LKNIVHIIDNLTLGGAETLLFSTIKKMSCFEHHIILLDPKIHIKDINNYAKIYCLNHTGWHSLISSCRKLQKLVATINPVIVHSHLFLSSFITRLALGKKYKIFYSIHTIYSAAIFKKWYLVLLEKYVYKKEHTLIAVSNYALHDYKQTITQCTNGNVLYNFIDNSFFLPATSSDKQKNQSLKKWVAVGSLKAVKNYETMISLFQRYYEASDEKEGIVLDIYGQGHLQNVLQDQINQASLPVRLMGKVDSIHEVLDKYDAYFSTSLYEGYGIAPMEAMSRGLPIFLSNIPVYNEVYSGYAFFLDVNKKESNSPLEAIEKHQAMSDDQKKTLAQKSKEYSIKVANGDQYIQRLMEIYDIKQ
jgi:glycosyltransferase involved in cell wall biosynthesis